MEAGPYLVNRQQTGVVDCGSMLELTIPRHVVPSMEDGSGLSPLQHAMIHESKPVRIYSAPTGVGKSYAFQRAVLDNGKRVLFIVPTRRLADNLARGLMEEFKRCGRSDDFSQRVFVWSSDSVARKRAADPEVQIGYQRISQVRALEGIPDNGVMIIATPESVAYGILNRRMPAPGISRMTIVDYLRFDHVVFDEFHTIQARGMGVSAAIAKLTTTLKNSTKLTFLSATPIEIKRVLVALGIDAENIVLRNERIVTGTFEETLGMRAVHGDVRLKFLPYGSPTEAFEEYSDEVKNCLAGERQVVLIYDQLKSLQADKRKLGLLFESIGLGKDDCLALNSIDDSVDEDKEKYFCIGRNLDPNKYRILVATSSIEMGVTFRAGLIIMDAGYDAASFVQRIGRVARGDESGSVLVCTSNKRRDIAPWLRSVMAQLADEDGVCEISRFMEIVLHSAQRAFSVSGDIDNEATTFRSMSGRAVWCAALFWVAMEETVKDIRGIRETLQDPDFRPNKARLIHHYLNIIAGADQNGHNWKKAFLDEARKLRNITSRVILMPPEDGGKPRSIPWHLYVSTPELVAAPTHFKTTEYGEEILEVLLDCPLEAVLGQLGTDRSPTMIRAMFPHQAAPELFYERKLIPDWLAYAKREAVGQLRHPERQKSLEAAIKLVELTGIVPEERIDSSGPMAGIL